MQRAHEQEAAEVESATPTTVFPKRDRPDTDDVDVVPTLATFETFGWIVIAAIARDDGYFVATRSESGGKIREVLCRGDHIRVEALVEEKNSQLFFIHRLPRFY